MAGKVRFTPRDRFWKRVNKSGPVERVDLSECWDWIGCLDRKGYGYFYMNRASERAHRAALMLAGVDIPSGAFVCHHCDRPICVRPSHLFVGTLQDNHADMMRKGRVAKGDKNGSRTRPESRARGIACHLSKLSEEQVWKILYLHFMGWTQGRIATEFNITCSNVQNIVKGRSWRHLGEVA